MSTKTIEQEIEELSNQLVKSQEGTESDLSTLKETIKDLGPEEIKKAITSLNDNQKILLKSVLTEMAKSVAPVVTMDDQYAAKRVRENIKDTNFDTEFGDDNQDEKLVKPEAAQMRNQGGSGAEGEKPWEGQIIKSEMVALKAEIIKSYVAAGLEYNEEIVKACMKKKLNEKFGKKPESKEKPGDEKKEAGKPADMKKSDILTDKDAKKPEDDQVEGGANKATEGTPKSKKENCDNLNQKSETNPDQIKIDNSFKKSVQYTSDQARLHARTGGRNHHFNVNAYYDDCVTKAKKLEASDDEVEASFKGKKSDKKPDAKKAEKKEAMKKSNQKLSINDMIEFGFDTTEDARRTDLELNKHNVNGSKPSFSDMDIATAFNLTPEEMKKILG